MIRNLSILGLAALIIALPFLLRKTEEGSTWRTGDPSVVIVTPHNEAIRHEFGRAFSRWHQEHFGQLVKVDWRAMGGTTEISRYLTAEYAHSGSCGLDLFFGGGEYDHAKAAQQGMTVPPWPPGEEPEHLFTAEDGTPLIPKKIGGETWRTATFFGTVVGTFGLCYNTDRLHDLGVTNPPTRWTDLADPAYFRQLGAADPTKSGSIAKAFEMLIHQQCYEAIAQAGYPDQAMEQFEQLLANNPASPDVPDGYQRALEQGWLNGLLLAQKIGANARYFTDSASKVPLDVSMGNAAVGLAIDFYGRFQAQSSRLPDGREPMVYLTPMGGSSVSCDPISLMRGAPNRIIATRFIEFVLGEEGQRLWCYKPGTPGGPEKFALRRMPIRRDFYPSTNALIQARHEQHALYAVDQLENPRINPYALAEDFIYHPRWTGRHFGVQRDLIRAMCLDSATELQAVWQAILQHGGPSQNPEAMALLERMPPDVNWHGILHTAKSKDRMDYLRDWTTFFRDSYREAQASIEMRNSKLESKTTHHGSRITDL